MKEEFQIVQNDGTKARSTVMPYKLLLDRAAVSPPTSCHRLAQSRHPSFRQPVIFSSRQPRVISIFSVFPRWAKSQITPLRRVMFALKTKKHCKRHIGPRILSPKPYLIFVIFFTRTHFESYKFYTRKVRKFTTKLLRNKTASHAEGEIKHQE